MHSPLEINLTPRVATPAPPDVGQDFSKAVHMPISSGDIGGGTETHTIVKNAATDTEIINSLPDHATKLGKDLIENKTNLGNNRHVECTDCHNPHRLLTNQRFNGLSAGTTLSTHDHSLTSGDATMHTNIASGALLGTWGVEPNYNATGWGSLPADLTIR